MIADLGQKVNLGAKKWPFKPLMSTLKTANAEACDF